MEPARPRSLVLDLVILACGVVTSGLALGGVSWLATTYPDFEVMGWYVVLVIPAGPIAVGALAGSGFGATSWISGRKVGGGLLATILLIQTAAYAAAQWIQFDRLGLTYDDGTSVPFLEYFGLVTRSLTLTIGHAKEPTGALGAWGYAFRVLELAGFAGGGLVIPAALRSQPYCEACGRYMRSRTLLLIPASVPARKVSKKDLLAAETYRQEMEQAIGAGTAAVEAVWRAAESGDAGALRMLVDQHAPARKATEKLPHRIAVGLSECGACHDGLLVCNALLGQGQHTKTEEMGRRPVAASLVRALGA